MLSIHPTTRVRPCEARNTNFGTWGITAGYKQFLNCNTFLRIQTVNWYYCDRNKVDKRSSVQLINYYLYHSIKRFFTYLRWNMWNVKRCKTYKAVIRSYKKCDELLDSSVISRRGERRKQFRGGGGVKKM